jgi:hypothetical protein
VAATDTANPEIQIFLKPNLHRVDKIPLKQDQPQPYTDGVSSVPGRIVTFSTKTGVLGHWKRDLAI